jgi:hypothetical protein
VRLDPEQYTSSKTPGSDLNQTQELSRVKARIRALTEKTVANGCTEAEALSAAEMVGRLLERYALSMDEIEVRSARCVQIEVELASRRRSAIDGAIPAVARFCDCKVWLVPAPRSSADPPEAPQSQRGIRYIFFGFVTDATLAAYLFAVINRAIATETVEFKRANPRLRAINLRRASSSFQHGLVARVAARLDTMHEEREASVRAQRVTGTALILVKNQVVEDAFRQTDVRLVSMSALGPRVSSKAYQAGWAAGDRVNLGRPVQGEGQGVLT